MKEMINVVYEMHEQFNDIAYSLRDTAESARHLGLDRLAARCEKHAEIIVQSAKIVSDACGAAVRDELKRVQESSGNMLSALLVGCEIGERKTDESTGHGDVDNGDDCFGVDDT